MGNTLEFWKPILDKYAGMEVRLSETIYTAPYKDRFFRTLTSLYCIEPDGTIFGNAAVDGARIAFIGGIEPRTYEKEYHDRGWCCRKPEEIKTEEVVDLIVRHGRVAKGETRWPWSSSPATSATANRPLSSFTASSKSPRRRSCRCTEYERRILSQIKTNY